MGGLKSPPIASRRRMTAKKQRHPPRGEGKKFLSGGQCEGRRRMLLRLSYFLLTPIRRNSGLRSRAGRSPKLAAFVARNGPLDHFVCFANRSLPSLRHLPPPAASPRGGRVLIDADGRRAECAARDI